MAGPVLHLTDAEAFGGAENAILTLLGELDRERWRPLLAHNPGDALRPLSDGAADLGVPTWRLPRLPEGAGGARRLPRFVAALRKLEPELAHIHMTWQFASRYQLLGAVLARVPVVATVQLFVEADVAPHVAVERRLLTRRVGRYIAVSRAVKARLETLGWPPQRIQVIPNGVDTASFRRDRDPSLRAALAPEAAPLVLVPGRLDAQKGHRHLLRAAAEVPDATFALAGDGPLRAELEGTARRLGIADRVRFLGYRRDVPELLAASDLVVLPSLFEGLPLAVLEAMAAARPVIATRIEGVDEVVRPGVNGLLVPPADPAALAAAVRALLGEPDRARRLAEAGRQTVERHFGAAAMAARVSRVYEDVLAGARATG